MGHEHESSFSVNQPVWHGLATVLSEYPSREKAREVAGLGWEPLMVPSFGFSGLDAGGNMVYAPGDGVIGGEYRQDDGFNRVVRSDTGATLAHASDSYTLIGHGEMFDIIEMVLEQANVKYETAGVLRGGKAVWVLVRLDEPISLPGDPSATLPYLVLLNKHDGTGACRLLPTMVRVVCMNTFKMAEMDAARRGATYKFIHRSNWRDRVEEVRQTVYGVREEVKAYERLATELLGTPVTPKQTRQFVETFAPMPSEEDRARLDKATIANRVAKIEDVRADVWRILLSDTTRVVARTAYGWVQAAGEYADHGRKAASNEARFTRSMVGNEDLKKAAFQITRQLIRV